MQQVVFFLNAVCLFGELFLFCFVGTLVLSETQRVGDTVYDLRWYEYALAEQRMFVLMLARNAREMGFDAFGYFKCNLETFKYVSVGVYPGPNALQLFHLCSAFVDCDEGVLVVCMPEQYEMNTGYVCIEIDGAS